MNAYEKLDTRPCYKCKERQILCHSMCERYKAYRADLDDYNAEVKRQQAGTVRKHWKKCCGKWIKVR